MQAGQGPHDAAILTGRPFRLFQTPPKTKNMNRTIKRLMLIFVGAFALATIGVVVYQVGWAVPGQACETRGDWWDWRSRTCARPVLISDITGRVIDSPQQRKAAKEAAAKARAAAKTAAP